jgi:hypothetical protein
MSGLGSTIKLFQHQCADLIFSYGEKPRFREVQETLAADPFQLPKKVQDAMFVSAEQILRLMSVDRRFPPPSLRRTFIGDVIRVLKDGKTFLARTSPVQSRRVQLLEEQLSIVTEERADLDKLEVLCRRDFIAAARRRKAHTQAARLKIGRLRAQVELYPLPKAIVALHESIMVAEKLIPSWRSCSEALEHLPFSMVDERFEARVVDNVVTQTMRTVEGYGEHCPESTLYVGTNVKLCGMDRRNPSKTSVPIGTVDMVLLQDVPAILTSKTPRMRVVAIIDLVQDAHELRLSSRYWKNTMPLLMSGEVWFDFESNPVRNVLWGTQADSRQIEESCSRDPFFFSFFQHACEVEKDEMARFRQLYFIYQDRSRTLPAPVERFLVHHLARTTRPEWEDEAYIRALFKATSTLAMETGERNRRDKAPQLQDVVSSIRQMEMTSQVMVFEADDVGITGVWKTL